MNTYVKITIIGAGIFVTVSVMMFAMPFILLVFFLSPEAPAESEIPEYGNCTISREGADMERYLMIPEQSCELVCLDAGMHGANALCQFESESIFWDKVQ